MYTQCPDCATIFRVTAEVLKAAQGNVRCGVCATTFNALENLSEQPFRAAQPEEAPSADDSMTVEELPGTENIELGADAPEAAPEPAAAGDDEDRSLEFHGNVEDLDRLFVIETPPESPPDSPPDPPPVAAPVEEPPSEDLDRTDEHPILILEEKDEPFEREVEVQEARIEEIVLETPQPPTPSPVPPPEPARPAPRQRPPAVSPRPPPPPSRTIPVPPASTAPRILIPDEIRKRLADEAEARASAEGDFSIAAPADSILSRRGPWIGGVAVLALALAVQIIHSYRHDLVKSAALGPVIAGAYSFFGLSPLVPTELSAYELRQWGAASDPNETGRLLLRASIVNRAKYAQPLPLLRLALQDRFGGTLGLRDIGPSDYLPGGGASTLLEPGERADALIRIVDPGPAAVGFELDVCLPAQGGVRCANQVAAASQ